LLDGYPRTERARGYLEGVSAAARLPIADDLADDVAGDVVDDGAEPATDLALDRPEDESAHPNEAADAG
jgi:hypothetical protein